MDLSPAPNRMKTIFAVLIFLLFAFPDSVRSELYKWVDENGKVHFTDSPRNIPKNPPIPKKSQEIPKNPKKTRILQEIKSITKQLKNHIKHI